MRTYYNEKIGKDRNKICERKEGGGGGRIYI
jgi:hypothetical protein